MYKWFNEQTTCYLLNCHLMLISFLFCGHTSCGRKMWAGPSAIYLAQQCKNRELWHLVPTTKLVDSWNNSCNIENWNKFLHDTWVINTNQIQWGLPMESNLPVLVFQFLACFSYSSYDILTILATIWQGLKTRKWYSVSSQLKSNKMTADNKSWELSLYSKSWWNPPSPHIL